MPLSVVILAAGRGKRMNSDLPKVLQPLAGEPLLQHVISAARALDPANVYVVYGHGGAQVQAALAHENVDWVLQADQLGTGHAVMQAMCLIPDDHTVLVLYGDVPLIRSATLTKLIAAAGESALSILSVNLDEARGYGRLVRNAEGRVISIVEHKDATPTQLEIREVNSGLMAAPAGALREWLLGLGRDNKQREYFLTDVVAGAAKAGARIEAIRAANPLEVAGVNDKIQLSAVEAGYRRLRAEELMLAGATLADPARIDIRGDIQVGRDVFIDVNAVLTGRVHLAAGVKVGPNCVIADSRIGEGTEIFANSVIDRAIVAQNCRIGPFARLRPGTVMHREVHIGNFVEVKNTEIGAGSKANHLTYLGDSHLGKDVNVGAGSITCNYDGANKWPTFIEDGAFIGSGTMMVAPLRIGARSNVGAGSTIASNTPDDKLTFERAQQITKENWTRPVKLNEKEKAEVIAKKTNKPKE
ncbi:MAG TPA: bifunctional UDP-N-acetylglucosamine diphosphorylase/glucosamine-1-phosphate N-acetyltransferase GlmU [Steroidobacteraceae bacterium]|jgi:bifunctional UDP-N-acetylglucosamine pyrophosphorylase/glucosamine-1-phosphate N-acetyltransferase|nr:bifunctional UDP-N-acetylglucosamine diphosphorylase/glucosamine-1-phosphate N-acetyltransferase GlmU [Steroidobacteraceae bacterium]